MRLAGAVVGGLIEANKSKPAAGLAVFDGPEI